MVKDQFESSPERRRMYLVYKLTNGRLKQDVRSTFPLPDISNFTTVNENNESR